MSESKINLLSQELAKEISNRSIFDIQEVATLIKVGIQSHLRELTNDFSTHEESRYLNLLAKHAVTSIHDRDYNKLTKQLEIARIQKAKINRLLHSIKRGDEYQAFKNKVIEELGEEFVNDFTEQYRQEKEQLIEN